MDNLKYFHVVQRGKHTYYRVRRQIQKKEYLVIWTTCRELAMQCYLECVDCDWQPEKLEELRRKYQQLKPTRDNQYIQHDDKGGYRISKWSKGRVKYYGKTSTLENARRIRDHLIRTGWKRPHYTKKEVSPTRGIQRLTTGKYKLCHDNQYYGTFNTYHEAIQERRKQEKEGWKQRPVKPCAKNNPYRHIQKTTNNKYSVKKIVGGQLTSFAVCESLGEAVEERDFFESIDWDWDMLDLY